MDNPLTLPPNGGTTNLLGSLVMSVLTQAAAINVASTIAEFAINWLIQSTVLILFGLMLARLLVQRGSAAQSVIYRTTLAGVLLCPLVTWGLGHAGVSGWSVELPTGYTYDPVASVATPIEFENVDAIPETISVSTGTELSPMPEFDTVSNPVAPVDSSPMTPSPLIERTNQVVQEPQFPSTTQANGTVVSTTAVGIATFDVSWAGLLFPLVALAWLLVSGYFLSKLAACWWRMSRLVSQADLADETTRQLCQQLAQRMQVKPPAVRRSPFIPSPCLAGPGVLERPQILLPADDINLSLQDVLVHELAHLRRGDCQWNLLRQLATSVFFFQPLMWVLSRRIEMASEEVCDDFVVQFGGDRQDYANRLVDIAELSVELSAAAVAAAGVGIVSLRSMLARRVARIMDTSRSLSTRVGNLLLVAVLLCGLVGTGVVGLVGLGTPSQATESQEEGDLEKDPSDLTSDDAATSDPTDQGSSDDVEETVDSATVNVDANGKQADETIPDVLTLEGIVVDPSGKPVESAELYVVFHIGQPAGLLQPKWKPHAKTNAKGEFRFDLSVTETGANKSEVKYGSVVAAKDGFGFASAPAMKYRPSEGRTPGKLSLVKDQPIKGRIIDIEGQPVANASLTLVRLYWNPKSDLVEWHQAASKSNADFYSVRETVAGIMNGPQLRSVVERGVTGEDGRFEIRGVGAGRVARFLIEGPAIETDKLYVRTETGEPVELPRQSRDKGLGTDVYYPAEFEHVSGPSIPIVGTIRDKETNEPIAGVTIKSQHRHGHAIHGWGEDFVRTITDDQGRYRLEGMPIGKDNKIAAIAPSLSSRNTGEPNTDQPAYISVGKKASTSVDQELASVDIEMPRGVWLHGQITDKRTGAGRSGEIAYYVPISHPQSRRRSVDERDRLRADQDGRFRIAVFPGKGYFGFRADVHDQYPRATQIQLVDDTLQEAPQILETGPSIMMPSNYHIVKEFDTGTEKSLSIDLRLDAGLIRHGQVVDSDKKPVVGFHYYGKRAENFGRWQEQLNTNEFSLEGYNPDQTRHVYLVHAKRNLAAYAKVSGDVDAPLDVVMQSAGAITGRLIDEDGEPLVDRALMRWGPSMRSANDPKPPHVAPLPLNPNDQRRQQHRTDEQGRFSIKCLVPGIQYRIMALPNDRRKFVRSLDVVINLKPGESKDLGDVKLVEDSEAFEQDALEALTENKSSKSMKRAGGRVTQVASVSPQKEPIAVPSFAVLTEVSLPNGQPAVQASVALTGYDRDARKSVVIASGTTDDSGRCELNYAKKSANILELSQMLLVRKDGYGVGWASVDGVAPGKPKRLEIKLAEQGEIKGRLVDIEGQPSGVERLKVQYVVDPAKQRSARESYVAFHNESSDQKSIGAWFDDVLTDKDGRFTIRGVPKKHGVLVALVGSEKFAPQDIAINTQQPEQRGPRDGTYRSLVKNVAPGEEAVLTLSPAKAFVGTISYEDTGEPAVNAKVSIWASQQEFGSMVSVETQTDDKGKYRLLPKPGIRFGVSAYPPSGVAYMGREAERVSWENGDIEREINIKLPRVTLVRGRVVNEITNKPIPDATVTFEGSGKYRPENAIDGWQAQQKTDEDGRFTYAVPAGKGTLVVHKKDSVYVLSSMPSREMTSTSRKGGTRFYGNAFHTINVPKDTDAIDAEIKLRPGKTVQGVMVDEQGKPIEQAFIISRSKVWDLAGGWRGDSRPNVGSEFELQGLDPAETYNVHFLDAHNKLGATVLIKPSEVDEEMRVVLKQCGTATAKFIVEDEEQREKMRYPNLQFVLTKGVHRFDSEAMRSGKLAADQDFNANIDRINYGFENGPKFDDDLKVTLPALIPGATYRLQTNFDGSWDYKEFVAKSGENIELGEFTPKFRE